MEMMVASLGGDEGLVSGRLQRHGRSDLADAHSSSFHLPDRTRRRKIGQAFTTLKPCVSLGKVRASVQGLMSLFWQIYGVGHFGLKV